MNIADLCNPQNLKIISLIALSLLGLGIIRDFLTWWEIPIQWRSPVIPQSFVKWQANQFLYAGLVTLCVFLPGLFCWRLHQYKATIIISIIGLLGHFIYFNYFRY